MILINNKEFSKLKYSDVQTFLNNTDLDEGYFVEFKNDDTTTTKLAKEICAFSNTFGGYIFLGVEDDKTITGCTKWTEEKINNVFRDRISPNPSFDIKRLSKNGQKIYIIRIDEGVNPPYITNTGFIYERISSSSNPINNSATINRIMEKRKDNIKKIENKIYIEPIKENINNLCGYLDFGFSVLSRDVTKITEKLLNADFEKVSNILKETNSPYSISKVGYSICITIGAPTFRNNHIDMMVPAGLDHFMEILPDGSVRGRIIFTAPDDDVNSNVIASGVVSMMYSFFKDVYASIFDNTYCTNFIEARKYEKLTVLKLFKPKVINNSKDELYEKFEQFDRQHNYKYGSNVIINSSRIPMNDFYVIDKKALQERRIKYNYKNLCDQLFGTSYYLLGYIDKLKIDNVD